MFRKVALGTLLAGLLGVLVAGAIIRTADKTENVTEARGLSQGRGAVGNAMEQTDLNSEVNTQSNGRGRYGQGGGHIARQGPEYEAAPEAWRLYEGVVTQAPAAGVDLVIKTAGGEGIMVGTGTGYMEDQGFALQAGEAVQVQGYWEEDELKAASVTRLRDGETINLRDNGGRPVWAGAGRNAQATVRGGNNRAVPREQN